MARGEEQMDARWDMTRGYEQEKGSRSRFTDFQVFCL